MHYAQLYILAKVLLNMLLLLTDMILTILSISTGVGADIMMVFSMSVIFIQTGLALVEEKTVTI